MRHWHPSYNLRGVRDAQSRSKLCEGRAGKCDIGAVLSPLAPTLPSDGLANKASGLNFVSPASENPKRAFGNRFRLES
jgi:hypothetical protein